MKGSIVILPTIQYINSLNKTPKLDSSKSHRWRYSTDGKQRSLVTTGSTLNTTISKGPRVTRTYIPISSRSLRMDTKLLRMVKNSAREAQIPANLKNLNFLDRQRKSKDQKSIVLAKKSMKRPCRTDLAGEIHEASSLLGRLHAISQKNRYLASFKEYEPGAIKHSKCSKAKKSVLEDRFQSLVEKTNKLCQELVLFE